MKPTEKYLGREIKEIHEFTSRTDTFGNYYAAQEWLHKNGYSDGSTCVDCPVAVMRGEYNLPQKWRNMTAAQRNSVHGVMVGELRSGVVKVIIFKNQGNEQ